MKVAVVTHFPESSGNPRGGVEAVSVYLVKALSEYRDLEIHVVTADPRQKEAMVSPWNGVTIHRIPAPEGGVLLNSVGPWRRLVSSYLHSIRPDLVHAHDTYGLMVKGLPMPRVFTVHGFIHGDTLVSGKRFPRLRSLAWRIVEESGWADQPHIIAISPYVRERLSGIAKGIIYDVDNPISEEFFSIERREKKGVIFSAAVISPRKNTHVLVEAFGEVVADGFDGELRLAGHAVDPQYGRQVEEIIRRRGLEKRVTLLGRIGTDRIREEIAQASVFALLSLEENSPLGIEEAMASGVPVVTSNRCGMPYMVRHGESGFLVDPVRPSDAARHFRILLRQEGLRRKMGMRSKEIARDRFHPAVVARRTRGIYYEVVGNPIFSGALPEAEERIPLSEEAPSRGR